LSVLPTQIDTHQFLSQDGLVFAWQVLFQRQHNAVGNDGEQDRVFEWSELLLRKNSVCTLVEKIGQIQRAITAFISAAFIS